MGLLFELQVFQSDINTVNLYLVNWLLSCLLLNNRPCFLLKNLNQYDLVIIGCPSPIFTQLQDDCLTLSIFGHLFRKFYRLKTNFLVLLLIFFILIVIDFQKNKLTLHSATLLRVKINH